MESLLADYVLQGDGFESLSVPWDTVIEKNHCLDFIKHFVKPACTGLHVTDNVTNNNMVYPV